MNNDNDNRTATRQASETAFPALPEGGTREIIGQRIMDFALGCDLTPVLSERLTPLYMWTNMGGLDGNDGVEEDYFNGVEAYNIIIEDNNADFVVDRRSIYNPHQEKKQYESAADAKLVNAALKAWFRTNIFAKSRRAGSDTDLVDKMVCKVGASLGPCLKYGLLHGIVSIPDGQRNKTMHIEFYATMTNSPPRNRDRPRTFPYVHLWELAEVRFRMRAVTYSDRRFLSVHMPGYE